MLGSGKGKGRGSPPGAGAPPEQVKIPQFEIHVGTYILIMHVYSTGQVLSIL